MHNNNKNINLHLLAIILIANTFFINSQETQVLHSDDWITKGDAIWEFSNNEITGIATNTPGYIYSKNTYNNFELELEFMPDSKINSGVFIRCSDAEINSFNCYEVNIADLHNIEDYRTGSIIQKTAPLTTINTINKWNRYKIKISNDHIQVWINDVLTANIHDNDLTSGYIALQARDSGKIKFRNIRITPL